MKKTTPILLLLLISSSLAIAQNYRVNRTEEKKKVKLSKVSYGKNIISFSPFQFIATDLNEKVDLGVGFCYERVLNNEHLSVKLPISISLNEPYVYIMPAIKFYPTKQGMIRYAIGPQFLIGTGNHEVVESKYVGNVVYQQTKDVTRNQFGFLLNHSLNFTFTKSLFMSLEAGIGVKYADSHPTNNYTGFSFFPIFNGTNSNIKESMQFGLQLGYRF